MKNQHLSVRSFLIVAGGLLVCQLAMPASVGAQGWPEASAPATKPAATAVAPAKPSKKSASPAAAVAAPAAVKPEAKPDAKPAAKPEIKAEPKPAAASAVAVAKPAPAPAAAPAPMVSSDLVEALQRQSDVLAKLAAELQTQRAVIVAQQDKIKALEARPAVSAAPAAAAPAPVAPAPVAKAAPAPAPMPAITVETGGVKLKMAGLFQGWFTTGTGTTVDSFRMRRAELKFSGDMGPKARWMVSVDPAKALSLTNTTATIGGATVVTGASVGQGTTVLQDAYVALTPTPTFSVELGQQKVPLSLEGTQSPAKLETIDRPLFMTDKARGGGYGDLRDLGVMVRGTLFKGQLEYASGLFNGLGEGMTDTDKNNQKDLVSRVLFRPAFAKGLQFGGSFARDEFGAAAATMRVRQGAEFLYTMKSVTLKAEEMFGQDGAIARRGGYVMLAQRLNKSLQLAFRFDRWDPDTSTDATAATVAERDWLGGITYNVTKSGVALQANYIHKTFMNSITPSRDVLMANLQTAW